MYFLVMVTKFAYLFFLKVPGHGPDFCLGVMTTFLAITPERNEWHPLAAQFTNMVDLKDGLLNKRVCTVKFRVVESYFLCHTTHTDQAINQNGPGAIMRWYFTAQVLLFRSPS